MSQNQPELFTRKVVGGTRTYFFDIKQTRDGTRYLVISEKREKGGEAERNRIWIFEENLLAFSEGLKETLRFLRLE